MTKSEALKAFVLASGHMQFAMAEDEHVCEALEELRIAHEAYVDAEPDFTAEELGEIAGLLNSYADNDNLSVAYTEHVQKLADRIMTLAKNQ